LRRAASPRPPPSDAASKLGPTRTTEIYYERIRTESALAEFEQAFALPEVRFSK